MTQDRLQETLMSALKQALTQPGEQRLYRSGKLDGLFSGRIGAAGEAAAFALREGLLEVARVETRGRTNHEWVRLTPQGVEFLHDKESPVRTLQELLAVLRLNQSVLPAWLAQFETAWREQGARLTAQVQQWEERLGALCHRAEEALRRIEKSLPVVPNDLAQRVPWGSTVLRYLERRQHTGATQECTLPELFAALQQETTDLSVSDFHQGLRLLRERQLVSLWPAPEGVDLAQPEYALFEGGRLLYAVARWTDKG